jgi:hypothetical protein
LNVLTAAAIAAIALAVAPFAAAFYKNLSLPMAKAYTCNVS